MTTSRSVVYNACYGGFSLSREAVLLARELSGDPKWGDAMIKGDVYADGTFCDYDYGYVYTIQRHDPILVEVVQRLGEKANGSCADLRIENIGDAKYYIEDYDGLETVKTSGPDWL